MDEMLCPYCGEPVDPLADMDDGDWMIEKPHDHGDNVECVKGCQQISICIHHKAMCFECGDTYLFTATYIQPCNANGWLASWRIKK